MSSALRKLLRACQDLPKPVAQSSGAILESLETRTFLSSSVYSTGFQGSVGGEWSHSTVTTSPQGNSRKFLGGFQDQVVTLSLSGLPTHTAITLVFDLYVISTKDSDTTGTPCETDGTGGIDLTVQEGSNTLLDSNFTNLGNGQWYPATRAAGSGSFNSGTGALEVNTLGYDETSQPASLPGCLAADSVYRISRSITHNSSSVTFTFDSPTSLSGKTAYWGLGHHNRDGHHA